VLTRDYASSFLVFHINAYHYTCVELLSNHACQHTGHWKLW